MTRKPRGYWTLELCIEDARKFSSRYDWQIKSRSVYSVAYRNGWLDECCTHMDELRKPRGYWTIERCIEDAAGYASRSEWATKSGSAYIVAQRNGWLDECCANMDEIKKPKGHWTLERCKEDALRFGSRSEWKAKSGSAYRHAVRCGWIDECTGHMTRPDRARKWTLELCIEDARKFSSRSEWKASGSVYITAHKRGWLEECCGHMDELQKPSGYWTLEICKEYALRFGSRSEWKASGSSYSTAQRNGWLDECCAHMDEIKKPSGYWTLEQCKEDALRFGSRSEWSNKSWSAYSAAKKNGWLEECCAHMGTPERELKWTLDACIEDAAGYASRTEWATKSGATYSAAQRNGWFDEIYDLIGMKTTSCTAQRAFADRFREMIAGTDIELREEVSGLAGERTKVDMAFYRNGVPFLVVEYCGLYWHSEAAGKDKHYHRNRFLALREKGIRLITVLETQADNPVMENMIRAALGFAGEKIRASKCSVVYVSIEQARRFYGANHIQGGAFGGKGKFSIGLELSGRLVACMTFVQAADRHTGSGRYDWCLHRFATLANTRIHGAASKLFARFRELHPSASVVSYCDYQHFSGGTYEALGFTLVRENAPDYYWTRRSVIMPKFRAQRKFLPALLGDGFDPAMTEWANMGRAGYAKLWDCGKAVYAYEPKTTDELSSN